MGATKTHKLRVIELGTEDILADAELLVFRNLNEFGFIAEEEFLLALLDVVSGGQCCRNAVKIVIGQIYGDDLLEGAYERWREEWLKKR